MNEKKRQDKKAKQVSVTAVRGWKKERTTARLLVETHLSRCADVLVQA